MNLWLSAAWLLSFIWSKEEVQKPWGVSEDFFFLVLINFLWVWSKLFCLLCLWLENWWRKGLWVFNLFSVCENMAGKNIFFRNFSQIWETKEEKRLWQKRFSLVSVVKMGITILTYNKTKTKIIILPLPLRAYVKKPTGCHVKWLAASELKLQLAKCLTKREPVSQLLIDHLDVTQYEAQSQI